MEESKGIPNIRGVVIDPVKNFNVYGWFICGQMSFCLYRIYTSAGYKARQFGLPGHSVAEVYYDDKWHFLDMDMWVWCRTKEGHIASAFELSQNAKELIVTNQEKSNPCNLPDRTLEGYASMFSEAKIENGDIATVWADCSIQYHTMDFVLRPGESISRTPKEKGSWHLPERFVQNIKQAGTKWNQKPRERYEPFRTYGNGRWVYEPILKIGSKDFENGVFNSKDMELSESGLLGGAGAFADFYFYSPYIFCGEPEIIEEKVFSRNGCFLKVEGSGTVKILITDAEGVYTSVAVLGGSFSQTIDITNVLDGRYQAHIKVAFLTAGSTLSSFRFEAMIMTAPMALPKLVEGENEFTLHFGDKHKQKTVPYYLPIDFRSEKDLLSKVISMENCIIKEERPGWLAFFKENEKAPLSVTFRIQAPENHPMVWCYFYCLVKELKKTDQASRARVYQSLDNKKWELVSEKYISQSDVYWDCCLEGTSIFKKPVDLVYYKVESPTNLSSFNPFAHIEFPLAVDDLQIWHEWEEDDGLKQFEVPSGVTKYTIKAGKNPRNLTTTMKNLSNYSAYIQRL